MTAKKLHMYPVNDAAESFINDDGDRGFISLFRSIRKHWIWKDAEKLKWWIDILLEVNHSPKKVLIGNKLIDCNRGQSINSLLTWAKRWRTNVSAVRRFLHLLESDNMIAIENVSKTTRITVCKYASYQDWRNDSETKLKGLRNDDETEVKTNNNANNDNKLLGAASQPKPKTFKQFTEQEFYDDVATFKDLYTKEMLRAFYDWWSEKGATGKMKFQLEKTWETKKRLETWHRRNLEKNPEAFKPNQPITNPLSTLKRLGA